MRSRASGVSPAGEQRQSQREVEQACRQRCEGPGFAAPVHRDRDHDDQMASWPTISAASTPPPAIDAASAESDEHGRAADDEAFESPILHCVLPVSAGIRTPPCVRGRRSTLATADAPSRARIPRLGALHPSSAHSQDRYASALACIDQNSSTVYDWYCSPCLSRARCCMPACRSVRGPEQRPGRRSQSPPSATSRPRCCPSVTMKAGLLSDSDGRVLWARNPDARRSMASITKIMTAIVALENSKLNEIGRGSTGGRVGRAVDRVSRCRREAVRCATCSRRCW